MAPKKRDTKKMTAQLNKTTAETLKTFNGENNTGWTFGMNWDSSMTPQFDTYINNYLFPKLNETTLINTSLGNKFNWLAEDMEFIAQVQEEYVIKDMVPVNMNLTKNASLMLERNYPSMMTKLYGAGELKKLKFTLNNNDVRLGFLTLKDAVSYAVGVYKKRISDINLEEERTIKSMMIDYATNQLNTKQVTNVTTSDDLVKEIYNHLLYLQNNDDSFNEANKASNGSIGRYTTVSALENLIILTSDKTKSKLLNTDIANTYNIAGLDITNHIISFRDLGGTFRLTDDVTLNQTMVSFLKGYGDYQSEVGDIIPSGTVFTYDVSSVITDVEEIKPYDNELFAFIIDINALRYKRYTKDMLKTPFFNAEFDEWTYWLHYYSFKTISPFFNKALITKFDLTSNSKVIVGESHNGVSTTDEIPKTELELLTFFDVKLVDIKDSTIIYDNDYNNFEITNFSELEEEYNTFIEGSTNVKSFIPHFRHKETGNEFNTFSVSITKS